MIMFGENIQSAADPLRKVQEEYLFHSLAHPKQAIEAKVRQLRVIYQIDPKRYAAQKRTLPYVVCGIFTPPYRRTENFAHIENFIIDIDHLGAKGLGMADVRQRIQGDRRVLMCFTSPSEDGLKVMFRLKERCYDAGQYAIFYKEFLRKFSILHQLEQVADSRTSDATRACFVSIDPQAYYNPECESVDMGEYIDTANPLNVFDIKHRQDEDDKEARQAYREGDKDTDNAPDRETMERIKQRLNPKAAQRREKPPVYVPQQLTDIMDELKAYIGETGLVVTDVISIQYGKKIRIKMGMKEAEINLFHGKRGFSVVKSPRCGTNGDLNELCAQLIQGFIDTQ